MTKAEKAIVKAIWGDDEGESDTDFFKSLLAGDGMIPATNTYNVEFKDAKATIKLQMTEAEVVDTVKKLLAQLSLVKVSQIMSETMLKFAK